MLTTERTIDLERRALGEVEMLGQARVQHGGQWAVPHIFVLTLGYWRRSVYVPCLSEAHGDPLDAREQAFNHFGGHTREHLYDRPRTVCAPRLRFPLARRAHVDAVPLPRGH